MADTIAYIGRDLEDAIRLGILDRRDIPNPLSGFWATPTEPLSTVW
jgi:dGTP triphosphohydrolase